MPTNREILFIIRIRTEVKAAISQLGGDMKQVAAGMKEVAAAMTAATQAANAFTAQTRTATGSLDNLSGAANQAATNVRKAFGQTGTGVNQVQRQAAGAVSALQAIVTATAVLGTIKVAANFQQQMSTLQAVTGASMQDMARASDAAQKLGVTTQYTANQAAEALTVFAKAGFSVGDAITATTATLNLATVGQLTLTDAATTAMNVMNQFGLSAQNVGQIVDVLAKTDNMSALSVKDLAASFQYSGSVAKEAGVSINTMAGAFAVLADAGTRGSRAGTEMQDIVSRMLKPTAQAEIQLKQLGLSINDLDTTNLVGTFKKLRDAGMTTAQALAIFGQQGGRAALTIAANIPKLEQFEQATKTAGGTAQQVADTMASNLSGSFKKLAATVQDVAIALGTAGLLTALTGMVDAVRAAAATALPFLQSLSQSGHAVVALSAGITALVTTLFSAITAIKAAEIAMAAFNVVANANPFVRVATIVLGLAAALYSLRNVTVQWGQDTVSVGSIVRTIWEGIVDTIGTVITSARIGFAAVTSSLSRMMAPVGEVLSALVTGTANAVKTMTNLFVAFSISIKDVLAGLATTVADIFTTMIRGIADKTVALAQGLKDIATGAFAQGMEEVQKALSANVAGAVFDKMKQDADDVGAKIRENFSTDYVSQFVSGATKLFDDLKSGAITDLDDIKKRAIAIEQANKAAAAAVGGNTDLPNNAKPGAPIDPQAARDRKQRDDALARFNKRLIDEVQALRGEANMLGMTTEQRDRYIAQLNVEKSARDANIPNVQKAVDIYMREYDAVLKLKQAYEANPLNGIQKGFQQFADDGAKLADNVATAWKSALDSVSDNLADMVTGGKADWASMLKDFGKQMLSADFKNILTNGIKALHLDSFMPGMGASAAPIQTISAPSATVNAATVMVNGARVGDAMPGLGPVAPVTSSQLLPIGPAQPTTGSGISAQMWNFFQQNGMTNKYGLAAILGNSQQESGFSPSVVNGIGATGLFQEYASRANGMKAAVPNWANNPQGQMQYALEEMQGQHGQPNVWNELRNAKDPFQANVAMAHFERYSTRPTEDGSWEERMNFADDAMQKYGKNGAPGVDAVAQAKQVQDQVAQVQQQGAQAQVQQAQQAQQQLQAVQQQGTQQQVQGAQTAGAQVVAAQQSGTMQQVATAQQSVQGATAQYQALASSVTQAGQAAQAAAPAIAQTGQNVAQVGTSAQPAAQGVGLFGQGVSAVAGPLASAVPGLGQFAGVITQVINSLFSAGSGGIGGAHGLLGGAIIPGILHQGGRVGSSSTPGRAMAASVWAGAQRFHDGGHIGKLRPGEVPIIAKEGERMLNPRETKEYEAGHISSPGSSPGRGYSSVSSGPAQLSVGDINVSVAPSKSSGDSQKDKQNNADMAGQVGKAVDQHMTAWVLNQQRPGGLLYQNKGVQR